MSEAKFPSRRFINMVYRNQAFATAHNEPAFDEDAYDKYISLEEHKAILAAEKAKSEKLGKENEHLKAEIFQLKPVHDAAVFGVGGVPSDRYTYEEYDAFKAGVAFEKINSEKLIKALDFTLGCTKSFLCEPESKELSIGLAPSFYQTLSYEGDIELRKKYFEAKRIIKEYQELIEGNLNEKL